MGLRVLVYGQSPGTTTTTSDWQHDYAVAIAVAVAPLRRYHTTDGLAAAYVGKVLDPTWLRRLCTLPSGRLLDSDIVRDAAFWRRLQELLGEQRGRR
jgi:hypothetical protein